MGSGSKDLILIRLTPPLLSSGAERFSRDVELMIGKPVHIVMRISWCIITPAAMLVSTLNVDICRILVALKNEYHRN